MSKNRNRAQLKELTGKEYRIRIMNTLYDYCYICQKRCGSWYYDCSPSDMKNKYRHGDGRKIKNYKYRSFKTWKYNRKTQYKNDR